MIGLNSMKNLKTIIINEDTGKIIYASMYVNGEEINLYILNLIMKKSIMILKEKVLQNH